MCVVSSYAHLRARVVASPPHSNSHYPHPRDRSSSDPHSHPHHLHTSDSHSHEMMVRLIVTHQLGFSYKQYLVPTGTRPPATPSWHSHAPRRWRFGCPLIRAPGGCLVPFKKNLDGRRCTGPRPRPRRRRPPRSPGRVELRHEYSLGY